MKAQLDFRFVGLTTACLFSVLLPCTQSQAALVHQWNLDEGTGTVITDSVGSANGTLNGTVAWTAGGPPTTYLAPPVSPNWHLDFPGGSANYVNFGHVATFNPTNITVALWAKGDGSNVDQVLLSKHSNVGSPSSAYEIGLNGSGNMIFRTWNSSGSAATAGATAASPFTNALLGDGQWYFIVGTHGFDVDANAWKTSLYVNGSLIETVTGTGAIANNTTTSLMLGRRDHVAPGSFDGIIGGPVMIFNTALQQADIQAMMVPEPSGLVLAAMGIVGLLVRRRRARR